MTDKISNIKIPEDMNNGKNIPDKAAIAARAPPSPNAPTSPINTEALCLLWKRNPMQAPHIDDPKIASSKQYKNIANRLLEDKSTSSIQKIKECFKTYRQKSRNMFIPTF